MKWELLQWGTAPPTCILSVYLMPLQVTTSPRPSPPYLHTASDQRLEVGMVWEVGTRLGLYNMLPALFPSNSTSLFAVILLFEITLRVFDYKYNLFETLFSTVGSISGTYMYCYWTPNPRNRVRIWLRSIGNADGLLFLYPSGMISCLRPSPGTLSWSHTRPLNRTRKTFSLH